MTNTSCLYNPEAKVAPERKKKPYRRKYEANVQNAKARRKAEADAVERMVGERKPKPYSKGVLTPEQARRQRLKRHMEASKRQIADERHAELLQRAQRRIDKQHEFLFKVGDLAHVNPNHIDAVSSFLARKLGIKNRAIIDPSQYSKAGEVRQFLLNANRIAEGMVDEIGNISGAAKIKDMYEKVQRGIGKTLSADELNEFFMELIEVGQIPSVSQAYQPLTGGRRYLDNMYNAFLDRWEARGFDPYKLEGLVNEAEQFSSVLDDVRTEAAVFGVDVGDIFSGIGYNPRVPTGDFARRMQYASEADTLLNNWIGASDAKAYDAAVKKSRETFNYIPEDDAIVAARLKLSVEEMYDLMDDTNAWLDTLHNKLSAEQLDTMVDEGLISKVGLTSRQVFDYFVDQYDLPYKQLNEMFKTDPRGALKYYTDQLKRDAGKSGMVQAVISRGTEEGWVKARGTEPKGWVLLDGDFLKDRGIAVPQGYKDYYVHPAVAKQWRDILDMSTDSRKLSAVARTMDFLSSYLSSAALVSTGYIGRIALGGIISSFSAGTDLARLVPRMVEAINVLKHGPDKVLDNTTKRFGRDADGNAMYTELELYKEMRLRRKGDLIPHTPGEHLSDWDDKVKSLNPMNAKRAVEYMASTFKNYGGGAAAVEGLQLLKNINSGMYAGFGWTAAYLDLAFRWSALKTIMDPSASSKFGQLLSGQHFSYKNIEEGLRYIDEYFPTPDEAGRVTKEISRFIRPFFSYAVYAPPAALRHAIRNPSGYMNAERLQRLMNSDLASDDNRNPEGGWWSSDLRQVPHSLWKDTEGFEHIVMFTRNFDPIRDGWQSIQDYSDRTKELFGLWVGTSEEKRSRITNPADRFTEFIQEEFAYFNPLIQMAMRTVTGVDPRTGMPVSRGFDVDERTIVGLRLPPLAAELLSTYKPIMDLDRFNPFNLFGTPEIRNNDYNASNNFQGSIRQPGTPSWAGFSRKAKAADRSEAMDNWKIRMLQAFGARVAPVNVAEGMDRTYSSNHFAAKELKDSIEKGYLRMQSDTGMSAKDKQALADELHQNIDYLAVIEADNARVQQWLVDNKVAPKYAREKLRNKVIKDMRYPRDSFANDLINEMAKRHQEVEDAK